MKYVLGKRVRGARASYIWIAAVALLVLAMVIYINELENMVGGLK